LLFRGRGAADRSEYRQAAGADAAKIKKAASQRRHTNSTHCPSKRSTLLRCGALFKDIYSEHRTRCNRIRAAPQAPEGGLSAA
jgi:hypothetical protein